MSSYDGSNPGEVRQIVKHYGELNVEIAWISYILRFFLRKTENSKQLHMITFPPFFKNRPYPNLLMQNREQLPVQKPRTITRTYGCLYLFKRIRKTENNYRPWGVWSSTLPVYTGNCRRLLEQCTIPYLSLIKVKNSYSVFFSSYSSHFFRIRIRIHKDTDFGSILIRIHNPGPI
jgi:hypothetical protein